MASRKFILNELARLESELSANPNCYRQAHGKTEKQTQETKAEISHIHVRKEDERIK